jgi:hypothetical protein
VPAVSLSGRGLLCEHRFGGEHKVSVSPGSFARTGSLPRERAKRDRADFGGRNNEGLAPRQASGAVLRCALELQA